MRERQYTLVKKGIFREQFTNCAMLWLLSLSDIRTDTQTLGHTYTDTHTHIHTEAVTRTRTCRTWFSRYTNNNDAYDACATNPDRDIVETVGVGGKRVRLFTGSSMCINFLLTLRALSALCCCCCLCQKRKGINSRKVKVVCATKRLTIVYESKKRKMR